MTETLRYPIRLHREFGAVTARSRHFPNMLADGVTNEEALEEAKKGLAAEIGTYRMRRMPLPVPGAVLPGEQVVEIEISEEFHVGQTGPVQSFDATAPKQP